MKKKFKEKLLKNSNWNGCNCTIWKIHKKNIKI